MAKKLHEYSSDELLAEAERGDEEAARYLERSRCLRAVAAHVPPGVGLDEARQRGLVADSDFDALVESYKAFVGDFQPDASTPEQPSR